MKTNVPNRPMKPHNSTGQFDLFIRFKDGVLIPFALGCDNREIVAAAEIIGNSRRMNQVVTK